MFGSKTDNKKGYLPKTYRQQLANQLCALALGIVGKELSVQFVIGELERHAKVCANHIKK